MGALLGQGIGTPTNLRALPPHLYEVQRAVSTRRPMDSQRFQFISDLLEIDELVDDLVNALRNDDPDALFERFLHYSPQIFYGVELLSGGWESRLRRLLRLGIGSGSPLDSGADILESQAFDLILRHVDASQRDDQSRGRAGGISGVRDAMALALVARHISESTVQQPPFAVMRFYTETDRIRRAWRNRDVRDTLTYEIREHEIPSMDLGEHGVLRTTEYYLIRALFPRLAYLEDPPSHEKDVSAQSLVREKILDIYTIGDELAKTARRLRLGGVTETALAEFRVGDSTIGRFMDEVSDLSSCGAAWEQLMTTRVRPGIPERLLEQLTRVREMKEERADDLAQSLEMQIGMLDKRTREVAVFTEAYVHVHEALVRWKGAVRPRFGRLGDHVGLRRWGFLVDDIDEEALANLVDAYDDWRSEANGDTSVWRTHFTIELTHRMRDLAGAPLNDGDEIGSAVALLGFLWLIEDYASIANRGRALLDGIGFRLSRSGSALARKSDADGMWERVGGAVENLIAVADVALLAARVQDEPRSPDVDELVAQARSRAAHLMPPHRRFPATESSIAFGGAFIRFRIWRALNHVLMAIGVGDAQRLRHPALAKESLEMSSRALELTDREDPMHILLLNHCVYVASIAGLQVDNLPDLVRQLIAYRPVGTLEGGWSYHLDCTLAYHYYRRAAALIGHSDRDARLVGSARKDLREAERWLDLVPDDVTDAEVIAHRGLVRELEVELEAWLD